MTHVKSTKDRNIKSFLIAVIPDLNQVALIFGSVSLIGLGVFWLLAATHPGHGGDYTSDFVVCFLGFVLSLSIYRSRGAQSKESAERLSWDSHARLHLSAGLKGLLGAAGFILLIAVLASLFWKF